jgi:hypothetical protein
LSPSKGLDSKESVQGPSFNKTQFCFPKMPLENLVFRKVLSNPSENFSEIHFLKKFADKPLIFLKIVDVPLIL